jgi:hypothetical protein
MKIGMLNLGLRLGLGLRFNSLPDGPAAGFGDALTGAHVYAHKGANAF